MGDVNGAANALYSLHTFSDHQVANAIGVRLVLLCFAPIGVFACADFVLLCFARIP